MIMWNELGLSGGTAIIILIALYFVIKWAVKNGIKEAYSAITGKKTEEDVRNEKELKELGFELEDKKGINKSILFYIASVLFFIASAIGFTSGNESSMAIVWLCLGSSFLCLGSTHKKKENNTDDK